MSPRYREKPWSVYPKRVTSGAHVYYYYWYDERGKRRGPKSTGIGYTAKKDRAKAEREANTYCADLYRAGRLGTRADGKTLADFVEERRFFDWHRSLYVRGILKRSEHGKARITESYIRNGQSAWKSRIEPAHGGMLIDEITSADCEDLLFDWVNTGSAAKTVNNWRSYYSAVMAEAVRLDVLKSNPWDRVPGLSADSKRRGGLTIAEGKAIISPEGVDHSNASERMYWTATKLALLTGLRIAEICGLYTDDVKEITRETAGGTVTMHYLDIGWQYSARLKRRVPTKDKDHRAVPITPDMREELAPYLTGPGRYLFSHHPRQEMAMTEWTLRDWFKRRCDALGIDRDARNIKFHSSRRFFNTLLRRRVSGDVLRKMTGHDSDAMTEHYTDYLPEDLATIADAQSDVLRIDSTDSSRTPRTE